MSTGVFTIDSSEEDTPSDFDVEAGSNQDAHLIEHDEENEVGDEQFGELSSSKVVRMLWAMCSWMGPLFVLLILVVVYVAFVGIYLVPVSVISPGGAAAAGLFFHVFFVMLVISFIRAVFADAGSVPHRFKQEMEDLEQQARELERERGLDAHSLDMNPPDDRASFQLMVSGRRYCRVCRHITPERAHHCRFCQQCVMKMEHHCPWLNNCVGFYTQKYFILFLTYIWVSGLYTMVVTSVWNREHGVAIAKHVGGNSMLVYLMPVVSGVFGVGILMFSLMHYYLIFRNRTTIEHLQTRGDESDNLYDLGSWYSNWKQVMGPSPLVWFIPMYSTLGSGYEWGAHGLLSEMG